MLVSLKWLRDYVDLPSDLDVDDLAHRLTMASAEVEGIHRIGAWDRDLVRVGHVEKVEPHPDADRLRLVTVDFGGDEPMRVVCGAPNVAEGQRIAFAREGADLIDGHTGKASKLKRGTIRGVVSAGMVLSEAELGLSQAHEGIVVLPDDTPIGTPVADILGDTILDVHVWPNRADTMNLVGIAREIAAILGAARSQEVGAALGLPPELAAAI
ncbi:MAG: phenylalanine--tRNA ligase subunit beta, partial [Chloroflexota bacterium]